MAAVAMSSMGKLKLPIRRAEPEGVRPAVHVSPAVAGKAWTIRRSQTGFTLMELMIVVAIVAILAAVALPAYQNSVMKTWRSKATSCVTEMAQGMERRFTGAMNYGGTDATDALPPNTCTTDDGMAQRYAFSFHEDPDNPFVLQAEAQGTQAARDERCHILRINQRGLRTVINDDGEVVEEGAGLCW